MRPDDPRVADPEARRCVPQGPMKLIMAAVPRRGILLTAVWLSAMPAAASAQSAIAGVVKDPAGAVVPGVAVEARSPVLIERARGTTTEDRMERRWYCASSKWRNDGLSVHQPC